MGRITTYVSMLLLPIGLLWGPMDSVAKEHRMSVQGKSRQQLYFVENKGQVKNQDAQVRADIDFRLTATNGLNMFVSNQSLHYQWITVGEDGKTVQTYRLDVSLLGANPSAQLTTDEPAAYYENYFQSPTTGFKARSWNKVTYKNVYPNIDWVLYTKNDILEYDFVVRPGGDVSNIQLRYDGVGALQLNADGSITATTPMGSITENAPVSFLTDGRKINSRFQLNDNVLRFEVAPYEGTLIIDPVLEWATYYGGTGHDYGRGLAVDNSGAAYMTGNTSSVNLATTGAHQATVNAQGDAFLVKFDAAGNRLWATYFGGPGSDMGWNLVCDENNNVYMAGQTTSASAIAGGPNVHQSVFGGGTDAFLAKFDSAGNFKWCTYYGGAGTDEGWGVASDKQGYIYLVGKTSSASGIASGSAVHQPNIGGGFDAFLVKFDTLGNRQWATYLGGSETENPWTAKCDKEGNVYISGETGSPNNIATPGAHQTTLTLNRGSEAFLVKFASDGTRLWGTYYGGDRTNPTSGCGIAIDDSNAVYLTGRTTSDTNIATPGSHQPTLVNGYTSFLVKFTPNGDRIWGTYFGGTGIEDGHGADCDPWGNVYITGMTTSPDNIATAGAINTNWSGNYDAYVAKFNRNGVRLWGTYFGGTKYDGGWNVAADRFGSIYIVGFSGGIGISTPNSFQELHGGNFDAFMIRLSECIAVENPEGIIGEDSLCAGTSSTYSVPNVIGAHSYTWILPDGWLGNSTSDNILATTNNSSGRIGVVANGSCNVSDTIFKEVGVYPEPIIDVFVDGITLSTIQDFVSYQWYMNNLEIYGATDSTYEVIENGIYSVRVVDEYGCSHISRPFEVNNVSVDHLSENEYQIVVFPNPARDVIHIKSAQPVYTTLRTIEGRIISRQEKAEQIDITHLPAGLYFLQIQNEKGQILHTERLIKATL